MLQILQFNKSQITSVQTLREDAYEDWGISARRQRVGLDHTSR